MSERVLAHFIRGDEVWEVIYMVVERPNGMKGNIKMHGSEKPCICENREELRLRIQRQINEAEATIRKE